LVDGDEAFRAQHYADALTAYSRVLTDERWKPGADIIGAEEEALWLKALARWRLLTLNVALGNSTEAEVQYRQLQADFTPEMPGYSVVFAGATLLAAVSGEWEQRRGLLGGNECNGDL
jgi:hypothetical protein